MAISNTHRVSGFHTPGFDREQSRKSCGQFGQGLATVLGLFLHYNVIRKSLLWRCQDIMGKGHLV